MILFSSFSMFNSFLILFIFYSCNNYYSLSGFSDGTVVPQYNIQLINF